MDCKNLKINLKTFFLLYCLTALGTSYAQQCKIKEVDAKPFYFSQSGLISELYEKMKVSDSNCYQILLINFLGGINKKEGFYISIDSSKKFNIIGLTADSILFSGCINTTKKYQSDFIFESDMPKGFLISQCKNIISSHKKSVLLVFNHSLKKWFEYTSMDGYLKETLSENEEYSYLKSCVNLLKKVFNDFNLNISEY